MSRGFWSVTGLLLPLICCNPVMADEDHHTAYRLRQQANILPLEEILERLGLASDHRILEIETEFEEGRNLYEIEYLTPDGHVQEIKVDAASGEILKPERD